MSNPITQEFLAYIDKYGLIQPTVGGGSQNGILWTGESMIVMKDNNALPKHTEEALFHSMKSCEIEPGLMRRSPSNLGDQQAQDDYIGFLAACYVCGRHDLAEIVLNYGNRVTPLKFLPFKFVYNTMIPDTMLHPLYDEKGNLLRNANRPWFEKIFTKLLAPKGYRVNFSAWLGRMPQFVAHVYWAANKKPPLFYRIVQALVIYNNSKLKDGGHPDTWALTWLMCRTMDNRCWMGRLAAKAFYKNLYKIFGPEGFRNFHYIGGNHPITKFWVK